MVIAHTSLPAKDYEKSKKFYTDVLSAIGYTQNMEYGTAAGFNDGKNTDFWIFGNTEMVPMHVAFEVPSIDAVHAFYAAALKAGGTDNGAPGYRKDYWPGYYAAFIHDPDGHNIEAVFYDYDAK